MHLLSLLIDEQPVLSITIFKTGMKLSVRKKVLIKCLPGMKLSVRKKVLIKCLPGKLSGTNNISVSLYFIFTAYNNRDLEMALKVDTEALYVTGV